MGTTQKGRDDNKKKENLVEGQRGVGGNSRKKENSVRKVTIRVINGDRKG